MRRALVVEDDALIMRIERMALTRSGFEVLCASTGAEAVRLIREHPDVEVVLVDVQLGTESGVDLVRELRTLPYGGAIVVLSGDEESHRARDAGADVFLAKPFAAGSLVEAVESALTRPR